MQERNKMSTAKNCKHCNTEFTGRANRLYCSDSCKNQANNTLDLKLRRDSRFYANVMERNERILRAFMARPTVSTNLISKSELQKFGFNTAGPFIRFEDGYLVGEYFLKDELVFFFNIKKYSGIWNLDEQMDKLFPKKEK